ncbi:MAG: PKD domain-containing protein [Flavobacteriia bacterium]|nr:PKD domain-containing protein [Flavobacteriia bacterium]
MKSFLVIISLFIIQYANASHIVGGDIYYNYLGGNNYQINVTLYRDCFSSGAAYDDPLHLSIYNASNVEITTLEVPFPGSTNVPIVFNNPCVTAPGGICVEKATYSVTVNLPPTPGGYTASYQRCCRGPNVSNLITPEDTGLTLTTHIPGSETGNIANSSPHFVNYPPIVICNNDQLVFNHYAIDPDGDNLVYSLVTPFAGASSVTPMPLVIPPPNYANVNWSGGYSGANPLGPGATISIDPVTGVLTAQPLLQGLFVVGIRVQEYRNGVLVGQTVRDFLFKVISCNISMQAIVPLQVDMDYFVSYCQGLTVTFDNNSYGATSYSWDFGVPGITNDVSTNFEPTYTYPTPGTYNVTLIANPGWPCTDTTIQTMIVNEELSVSFTSNDSLCIVGNNFNFDGSVVGTNNAAYNWDFGPHANISNATTLDVNNVVFDTSGYITITLNSTIGTCATGYTDSIYIFPFPNVAFSPPPNYLCEGLTTTFINNTSGGNYYTWDFGVNNITTDIDSIFSPTYTYPTSGTYLVRLIAGSNGSCIDTAFQTLIMNEILNVSFTSNDSICITGNSFNFDGSYVGSTTTNFSWNFGPNSNIQNATTLDVNNVHFNQSGVIPITLTGTYGQCIDSYTASIYIFPEPTINFDIQPGLQCVPFEAHFIDLCTSPFPLHYSWNFGDGNTSNQANPLNIYTNVGTYDVSLSIHSDLGCIDTLYLTKFDLIQVHPSPVSNFSVDKYEASICNSTIQFTDLSIGGNSYFYMFDHIEGTTEQNPFYSFHDDGTFTPIQYVTNEFLCTDSSFVNIYISPFTVYIPNTFTPDGDEFNNIFKPIVELFAPFWEFKIYNRWGEIIFETNDQYEGWDGTYLGKMVQDGVYNYTIRYQSCENSDNWHELTGHFNKIR